eukprot:6176377-Pleurochrysis_carterae.AAC.2
MDATRYTLVNVYRCHKRSAVAVTSRLVARQGGNTGKSIKFACSQMRADLLAETPEMAMVYLAMWHS